MLHSFWDRGRALATPQAEKHFLAAMAYYLQGVAQQVDDRDKHSICTVDAYTEARRKDSAMDACFMPGELHLSIPDDAFYHPVMKELRDASNDLVVLDNVSDLASDQTLCGPDTHYHGFHLRLIHAR